MTHEIGPFPLVMTTAFFIIGLLVYMDHANISFVAVPMKRNQDKEFMAQQK